MRWLIPIFLLIFIQSFGQKKGAETAIVSVPVDSLPTFSIQKLDSLTVLGNRSSDSLTQVIQVAIRKMDSLSNVPEVVERYTSEIDSLQGKLLSRIDRLSTLAIPDTLLIKNLSQVNARLDSLKFQLLKGDSGAVNTAGELKSKITAPLTKIEQAVNEKLSLFSENGVKLPGPVNLPAANLNTQLSIDPNIAIPMEAPTIDLKAPTVKNPLEGIDLPGSDFTPEGSVNIPEMPNAKISEIKLPEDVSGIQDKLSGLSEAGEKIDGYHQDLKNLREGDLSKVQEIPDAIESRVEELEEINSLEKTSEGFAAIKAKWNDPQVLKELALNKAKETAINHFAGHEEELKAAMDKLSKLKAKIPDPEGAIDMFAKRQQFMKEKPIVERFLPGFAFQFQKQNSFWLDLNHYVGFKISGRWLAGLGWNERVAYLFDERQWDKENRIYGLRSFLHFKLKSNFWLKAEAESMNAPVRATPLMASEIVGRDWVWSYFAGIKKDFQFSKGLKANVQTLYNLYNPDKRSPYTTRLNIRMGFEVPIKKKKLDAAK